MARAAGSLPTVKEEESEERFESADGAGGNIVVIVNEAAAVKFCSCEGVEVGAHR